MFKQFVLISATILVLAGCGGSDSNNSSASSNSSTFKRAKDVTLNDLKVEGYILNKSQFLDYLYDSDVYIDNSELATRFKREVAKNDCLADFISQESKYDKTDEHTYVLEIANVDVSSCYSEYDKALFSYYASDVSVKDKSGVYHNFFTVFSDIPNTDIESSSKREVTSMYFESNQSGMQLSVNSYMATTGLDDFSKPCILENAHLQCRELLVSIVKYDFAEDFNYNNIGEDLTYYKDFKMDVITKNGRYYDSGTISFTINNWSGVITFVNSDTPPTFIATNGSTELEGGLDEERTITTK